MAKTTASPAAEAGPETDPARIDALLRDERQAAKIDRGALWARYRQLLEAEPPPLEPDPVFVDGPFAGRQASSIPAKAIEKFLAERAHPKAAALRKHVEARAAWPEATPPRLEADDAIAPDVVLWGPLLGRRASTVRVDDLKDLLRDAEPRQAGLMRCHLDARAARGETAEAAALLTQIADRLGLDDRTVSQHREAVRLFKRTEGAPANARKLHEALDAAVAHVERAYDKKAAAHDKAIAADARASDLRCEHQHAFGLAVERAGLGQQYPDLFPETADDPPISE